MYRRRAHHPEQGDDRLAVAPGHHRHRLAGPHAGSQQRFGDRFAARAQRGEIQAAVGIQQRRRLRLQGGPQIERGHQGFHRRGLHALALPGLVALALGRADQRQPGQWQLPVGGDAFQAFDPGVEQAPGQRSVMVATDPQAGQPAFAVGQHLQLEEPAQRRLTAIQLGHPGAIQFARQPGEAQLGERPVGGKGIAQGRCLLLGEDRRLEGVEPLADAARADILQAQRRDPGERSGQLGELVEQAPRDQSRHFQRQSLVALELPGDLGPGQQGGRLRQAVGCQAFEQRARQQAPRRPLAFAQVVRQRQRTLRRNGRLLAPVTAGAFAVFAGQRLVGPLGEMLEQQRLVSLVRARLAGRPQAAAQQRHQAGRIDDERRRRQQQPLERLSGGVQQQAERQYRLAFPPKGEAARRALSRAKRPAQSPSPGRRSTSRSAARPSSTCTGRLMPGIVR